MLRIISAFPLLADKRHRPAIRAHFPRIAFLDGGSRPACIERDHASVWERVGIDGTAAVDPDLAVDEYGENIRLGLDLRP